MRLVWHIAKKDLRRLAPPIAVWIGLIVVPTIAFRVVSPTIEGHASSSIDASVTMMSIWARLLTAIQFVLGYVLAAQLVLEDPLVPSTSFWKTRPVTNARLLAAKLAAASLLFIVAPLIALVPIWLASGFGVRETWHAAWEFAQWHGLNALCALTFASISRNLVQVMLYTVALVAAEFAASWLSSPFYHGVPLSVGMSRHFLSHAGVLPIFAFVLVQQFLTRRLARAWATLAVAFVVAFAIRAAWPLDVGRGLFVRSNAPPHAERPADRSAEIVAEPTLTKFSPNAAPTLFVTAPWAREQFYLPAFARFSNGTIGRGASGPGAIQAGLRVLGFNQDDAPLSWQVMLPGNIGSFTEDPSLSGTLEIWSVRPRVVGEVPLRLGARLANGAQQMRIVELTRQEGRLDAIFLEERDSHSDWVGGWSNNWSRADADRLRYIDRYYLVNRAAGKAQSVSAGEVGAPVVMNSLVLRYRRLHVSGAGDWEGAVLIKLRFEGEHRFERPLEVHGISSRYRTKQP